MCKQISADHGFWDEGENRSKGEMVALMNCELSEAIEAHRKPKPEPYAPYISKLIDYIQYEPNNPEYNTLYDHAIKGSIGEEMADTVIRICDYVHGWQLPLFEREYRKETTGNFAHDVLRLQWYVLLAFEEKTDIHPGKDWGYLLAAIIKFCEWYNIDLLQHMRWKMQYNKNRPYKHGKAY